MAPHGESIPSPIMTRCTKPPRLSPTNLQRTISDISFDLIAKEAIDQHSHQVNAINNSNNNIDNELPPILEVEDAKCECCGMSEECTPEYIDRVREKFMGKWICGLCSEDVKEKVEKNNGEKKLEEALSSHMSACVKFNKLSRAYPVLVQAEAMRQILKRRGSSSNRTKSISPRDHKMGGGQIKGGIARSSSCIAAITRDMNDLKISN